MKLLFLGHYYILLIGYFIIITTAVVSIAYVFRKKWTKLSRTRTVTINLLVSFFSIFYLLLALEGIFAYAFIESDGFGFTLTSKRWFNKYWNPINSYGYRDYEPQWRDKILFVVGDSFVAGHGIKKIDNRFSNLLSTKLGEKWTVTTLAKNGWNLQNYLNALKMHDKKPDVIIISYYINDIESAASDVGIKMTNLRYEPDKLTSLFINHSYMLNWIYWRVYRRNLGGSTYWNYLEESYGNNDVWNLHLRELDALINYAKKNNAKIAFVIWPSLRNVSESNGITSRISRYLTDKGVVVLDLSESFKKRNPEEMIVNAMDAHPNEIVHTEVSELLYKALAPWN